MESMGKRDVIKPMMVFKKTIKIIWFVWQWGDRPSKPLDFGDARFFGPCPRCSMGKEKAWFPVENVLNPS